MNNVTITQPPVTFVTNNTSTKIHQLVLAREVGVDASSTLCQKMYEIHKSTSTPTPTQPKKKKKTDSSETPKIYLFNPLQSQLINNFTLEKSPPQSPPPQSPPPQSPPPPSPSRCPECNFQYYNPNATQCKKCKAQLK